MACVPLCCDVSSAAAPSAPSPAAAVPRRVLLVGGTSEIGLAIVRRLSAGGPVRPYLLGRDRMRLEHAAASLGAPETAVEVLDADDLGEHESVIERSFAEADGCEQTGVDHPARPTP